MPSLIEPPRIPSPIRNLILDMDGVLWSGEMPTPGLQEFFAVLESRAVGYVLVTNNSTKNARQYADKLSRFGISIPAARILTSGEATALLVATDYPQGTSVYVIGEQALREALSARGFEVMDRNDSDTAASKVPLVVVGLDRELTYSQLARASALVAAGARFVGTNPDTSLPVAGGTAPGAGALLAAITATTGVEPEIIGKPHPLLFREALRRLGSTPETTAVVGDRLDTDIAGGRAQGFHTVLVLSGVTDPALLAASEVEPDQVFSDISDLATALSSRSDSRTPLVQGTSS